MVTRRTANTACSEKRISAMSVESLIIWLVIGAVAGWIAGAIVKGGGFGLIGDIIVGIVGAFIGGWLAGVLGIHIGGGIIATIITATAGAVVLLLLVRLIRRA
jgi:uncharacterized membrane protein YeaQ/YmgE (transglycosylase-associated protein family)